MTEIIFSLHVTRFFSCHYTIPRQALKQVDHFLHALGLLIDTCCSKALTEEEAGVVAAGFSVCTDFCCTGC